MLAATILIAGSMTTHATATANLDASRATKHTLATGIQVQLAVHKSVTPAVLASPIPHALDPSVNHLLDDRYDMNGCMSAAAPASPICTWGDTSASQTMVVFGDSHAQMWMAGFVRFAQEKHYKLMPLVKDGCSPVVLHIARPLPEVVPVGRRRGRKAASRTAGDVAVLVELGDRGRQHRNSTT